jgi:asparagine synthase (glutamine-hydrolysing)
MTYLADDILVKVDRMSMYHALEVRCPFLDHRVVELAFQMPVKFKIKGFKTKHILRRMAQRQVPIQTLKKSKQGFMIPLDIWFRGQLNGFIHDSLNHAQALWDRREALALLEEHMSVRQDHALKLWALAVLGLWDQRKQERL